jgi:hypothetical protein
MMYNTKAVNIIKIPKTQVSHVKQTNTPFMKKTVHEKPMYFCIILKLTQLTKLPPIVVTKKPFREYKKFYNK